jgi:hypothetical protein
VGAEPPGAQRQPNLQYRPTGYVLLLRVVPNLPTNPTGHVLLLNVGQPNLPHQPTGHVLLLSVVPNLPTQPAGLELLLSVVANLQLNPVRYALLVGLLLIVVVFFSLLLLLLLNTHEDRRVLDRSEAIAVRAVGAVGPVVVAVGEVAQIHRRDLV